MEKRLKNIFEDKTLDWEIPFFYNPYELSPYKDFYEKLPEGFIMYINEEPMVEALKARKFEELVQFTLARYGIDYLHPSFKLSVLQKRLYYFFKSKRVSATKSQRSREVLEDETTFHRLVDGRLGELERFFSKENMSGNLNIFQLTYIDI